MIDLLPIVINKLLETGVEVLEDIFIDSNHTLPVITVAEYDNYQTDDGDTLTYDVIDYMIKLYGDTLAEMADLALEIDELMRELGFKRITKNPLNINGLRVHMILYEIQIREDYNN